jgi:hypothetical protein
MNDKQNISASNTSTDKPEAQPINDLQAAEINSNLLAENPVTQEPGHTETIELVEPETINPKLQTEAMEVHHPHHAHHSKKWKDYLFEFLMLFLAVTLGFFVENQREHYIEGMREKQFIRSLVNDLRSDIVKLTSIIKIRTVRASDLDSLKLLVNSDSPNTHTNDIYYLASTAARTLSIRFIPNDGTMQQLKNSGAFRLIRNRIVSDSIAKYDVNVRNALRQSEVEEMLINDYRQAASKIFNALKFDEIMDDNLNVIRRPSGNPALANYTSTDLHNWNYKLYSIKGINRANRRDARLLLTQATNLLKTLQKEYHLENE